MTSPIYVDLQAAQTPSHAGRGIARYTVELTLAMIHAHLPVSAIALSRYHPPVQLPEALADSPLLVTHSAHTVRDLAAQGSFTYQLMSPMELDLTPSRTLSTTALRHADAVVAVLYDLIPLLFPDRYLVSPRSRATYDARLGLLRDLDLLLALSEHTRRDAMEHLGVPAERIAVIGAGASPFFVPPTSPDDPWNLLRRRHPEIRAPFLLTVAAWEWRKNLETLVRAVGRLDPALRRGRQLVVVCSGLPPGERSWHRVARAAGLDESDFLVIGPVPDDVLRALYQATELFVFPSRYEGFGLPVLEAACCGAPALTSSASSLPEILEHTDATFDPDDDHVLAEVLERALTDGRFRHDLLSASAAAADRHTWEAVGARVAGAYARLPKRSANLPDRRRLRVALVGAADDPLIARYAATSDDDMTVFAPGRPRTPGRVPTRPDVPVYPTAALTRRLDPFDYDRIVVTRHPLDEELRAIVGEHSDVTRLT